jgi:hypothetical protein
MRTWEQILSAAAALERRGVRPWSLQELIEEIQSTDPSRGRGTISPTLQGMTVNAPGGPPSGCGTPIKRGSPAVSVGVIMRSDGRAVVGSSRRG